MFNLFNFSFSTKNTYTYYYPSNTHQTIFTVIAPDINFSRFISCLLYVSFHSVYFDLTIKYNTRRNVGRQRAKFNVGTQSCKHSSRKFRGNCAVETFLVEKRARRFSSTLRNIFNLRHNLQRRLLHGYSVFRGAARYPDCTIRTSGRRQQIVMKFYFRRRQVNTTFYDHGHKFDESDSKRKRQASGRIMILTRHFRFDRSTLLQ